MDYTIFSDSTAAIERVTADRCCPGQALTKAIYHRVRRAPGRQRLLGHIQWDLAHKGVEGNGVADSYVKWAAETHHGPADQECLREASFPTSARGRRRPGHRAPGSGSETMSRAAKRYRPPRGGKVRKGLQQERKEMAGCFYQLLSDHASIESYLAEKVKIVQSSVCWWYGSGERQSRFLRVPSLSHPEQRHVERRREGLRVEAPNAPIRQAAFQRQGGSPSGPNLSMRSGGVVTLAPPEGGETGWRRGGRARAALKCTFLLSSACISSVLSYVLP